MNTFQYQSLLAFFYTRSSRSFVWLDKVGREPASLAGRRVGAFPPATVLAQFRDDVTHTQFEFAVTSCRWRVIEQHQERVARDCRNCRSGRRAGRCSRTVVVFLAPMRAFTMLRRRRLAARRRFGSRRRRQRA